MDVRVTVPALSFRAPGGGLDLGLTRRFAERAAQTWIDFFILSGSATRGDLLTPDERAEVTDIWLAAAPASRLVACCWCPEDIRKAADRGVRPLAVMRSLEDQRQALAFFAGLPAGAYVYSHPMYSRTTLDATLVEAAQASEAGTLPAGAKIAKISPSDVAEIRQAAGEDFALWDGTSRHVEASANAGATGVVATPLCALPNPFPKRTAGLQNTLDRIQDELDALPRPDRLNLLTTRAISSLT